MRNTWKMLAGLALAGQLSAGGFFLQVGNPEASKEAQQLGAVMTIQAAGCHDPATAKITATAIGVVNGRRREIPLKVVPMSTAGMFAVTERWPSEGTWVIELVGRNPDQFTNTLVGVNANGVDRTRLKEDMHQFKAADVEAMLK
ncbi:MAG TPA: hypothetical protein VG456_11230 [Candidatus Sulfopaludibacter sp.]|jgi:hypothetical protein|nr:hypothetical protein [Candidatus Sulfopaludibacter sp.]